MKRITLYVERDNVLRRLHPFAKLCYILCAVLTPLIGGALWMYALLILASLCLLFCAGLLKRTIPLIAFSFTIILTVFIVHGLFNHENREVLFALGALRFYREGVFYALRIGLNILNMLLAFSVLVLSTSPAELVDSLEQAGFSPRFGYMVNSVFQIIPQMIGTMNTIMDAQRSRGMETEGGLLTRAKAFIPLISPVVSSALINTRERAIALEVRGFGAGGKKTFLKERRMQGYDRIFSAVMFVLLAAAAAWRIWHAVH